MGGVGVSAEGEQPASALTFSARLPLGPVMTSKCTLNPWQRTVPGTSAAAVTNTFPLEAFVIIPMPLAWLYQATVPISAAASLANAGTELPIVRATARTTTQRSMISTRRHQSQ